MSAQALRIDLDDAVPDEVTSSVVILAESNGRVERALLDIWLAEKGRAAADVRAIHFKRPRETPVSEELIDALHNADTLPETALLTPVRVIWQASKRSGPQVLRWRDALRGRDPRDPSERAKARLVDAKSDRWQILEAEPALLSDLRKRWQVQNEVEASGLPRDFAQFIARQAELALERAEYRARGARYKVPRIYKEDVAARPSFRRGVARLSSELNRGMMAIQTEALEYLDELRTAHDPFVLDLAAKAFHWMYAKGYGEVDVEPAQIERLRETFARHPVLLLPSHKTNLDSPIVESVLAQHNLPPPTLFAGINMSYWPIGPLMRRAGRVFLRRKISDNPVYSFALREWLGYLIEKRFNLEWFPEGTRSRTGKLLPPKLGLLAYAADAYRQGHVDDLMLVPMSIIYDQSTDVATYAREAQGEKKNAENLAWMLRGMRQLGDAQGKVYLRVGEPISMRAALGPPSPQGGQNGPEERLALHKLALAVAWQTNQATPITGISIVTCALLAAGQRAVTMSRIMPYASLLVRQARDRKQPLTKSAELDSAEEITAVLDELIRTGVVARYDKGIEVVYSIAEGQHLAAAFYRNAMLHFVLDRAIGELAILTAAEAPAESREERFWEAALRLREALKFEFFFQERTDFERQLEREITSINPDWRQLLKDGSDPVTVHRSIYRLGIAHAVLRPFLEAYGVVAAVLLREPANEPFEENAFIDKCQRLGRQMLLQHELRNPESVSKQLFATGVQLIKNLKLMEIVPGALASREEFASGTHAMLKRLNIAEDNATRTSCQSG